jgi:hypothetical protein
MVRRFGIILGLALALASSDGAARELMLGDWLAQNNPRVIAFLQHLTARDVGSRVRGVKLSDGTTILHGQKYVGQVRGLPQGAHVFLFARGAKSVAYIWVEARMKPFPLPSCARGPDDDESSTVLSGDVYTLKSVQPTDGVVISRCPTKEWLGQAGA